MSSGSNPKDLVTSFLGTLNKKDPNSARSYLADNVSFSATDGTSVYGAEAYMDGWKKLGINYEISKAFVDGDDVCILYDLRFSKPPVTVVGCGLYHVIGGKIDSIKVIFDPRPILPQQEYARPAKTEPNAIANRKITG